MSDETWRDASHVLWFISGKYEGGVFPIEANTEVLIGRESSLHMVLIEELVSRRHARFTAHGGHFSIEDLGSTNGTYVNGKEVEGTVTLEVGDRILVGTSILVLTRSDDPRVRSSARTHDTPQREQPDSKHTITGMLAGRLGQITLPDILQILAQTRRTGQLSVQGPREQSGWIRVADGRVLDVRLHEHPDMSPQRAFTRMISWEQGGFVLDALPSDADRHAMDEPMGAMVMEAMRQLDELALARRALPPSSARLTLGPACTPEHLEVLRIVASCGSIDEVLDRARGDDVRTAQIIGELMQSGLVVTG